MVSPCRGPIFWLCTHARRTVIVGGGVHVCLSKLFPDHNSLISESVYAHEVLADRLAMAGSFRPPSSSSDDDDSEKGKHDGAATYVSAV